MRIAVIGAGAFASRRHLPELQTDPRVHLVAACRRNPEALARVADHFGIPGRYADWREMLDAEALDGVLIATPHDQHFAQARAALERGLHVLLEKPMALTVPEAQELMALAAEKHVCLGVALNPPYWRHTEAMRVGGVQGRLGALESVHIHWSGATDAVFGRAPMPEQMPGLVRPTLFRADAEANGGGNLMDGGGHLFSELLWVTGRRALEVSALMDHTPADSRAAVTVRLEGNLLAVITMLGDSRYPERRISSRYDGDAGSVAVTGLPFRLTWRTPDGKDTQDEAGLPPVPTPVGDWLDAIETGRVPLGSPAHGVEVTKLLAAAYESAANGRTVKVMP